MPYALLELAGFAQLGLQRGQYRPLLRRRLTEQG